MKKILIITVLVVADLIGMFFLYQNSQNVKNLNKIKLVPESGEFYEDAMIKVKKAGKVRIYYTTDGKEPNKLSKEYKKGIELEGVGEHIVKIKGYLKSGKSGDVVRAKYRIKTNLFTPTPNIEGGAYTESKLIELSSNEDAVIKYTIDGSVPTIESEVYTEPILVERNIQINAIAYSGDLIPSKMFTGNYFISGTIASPKADHKSGLYKGSIVVKSSKPEKSELFYTLDGSEPTENSKKYSSKGIKITRSSTLKIKAFRVGWVTSNTSVYKYKITGTLGVPKINLNSGAYSEKVKVAIKISKGEKVFYTLDGTSPTNKSKRYSKEITLTETTTLKARSYKDNWKASPIVIRKYFISHLIKIEGGKFIMGDVFNRKNSYKDERPAHKVMLNDFKVSKYETTVGEYYSFCKDTGRKKPSKRVLGKNMTMLDDYPIVNVSWLDAISYCNWLSKKSGLAKAYNLKNGDLLDKSGKKTDDISKVVGFRLLTEAEWEYIARNKGEYIEFTWGNGYPIKNGEPLENIADKSARKKGFEWDIVEDYNDKYPILAPVGSFKTNNLKIADLGGNVSEWCYDWQVPYNAETIYNPSTYKKSDYRVVRGGSWGEAIENCRTIARFSEEPNTKKDTLGFRVGKSIN